MTATTTRPPSTTGIVERARAAARTARRTDPNTAKRPPDHQRAAHRRRIAEAFARAYGLDPADVIITDDPDRAYGTWRGHLVTITEAGYAFRFLPVPGFDQVFLAIGPCPACGGDVPIADASDLAAFGHYLDAVANEVESPRPPEFRHDPGHALTCRYSDRGAP